MRSTCPSASPRRASGVLLAALVAAAPLAASQGPTAPAGPHYRDLYLVRHGDYDAADPREAHVGKALVPLGVAQARLLGARLAALPGTFSTFRASPLTRARQTAEVVAAELAGPVLEIDPLLEECTPPTRRREVIEDETPEALAACRAQLERLFAERFRPAAGGGRAELLVAHGNVIRYLVTRALGVDPTAWLEMSIGHASLTVIRVEPDGRFKVLAVGDVGHLPASMVSGRTGDPPRELALP